MNQSRFVTLNMCAPSMHGLQASGRELCHHRRRSERGIHAVGSQAAHFTGFSPLAILLSFLSVPSFRINNYDPLLVIPFLLDSTALILAARLALGQQSRASTKFLAFVVPLQLQNTDSSASIGRATSPDGISTCAMSVITKQFHNQSYSVIPLFRYSVFRVLQRPTRTSEIC